MMKIVQPEAPLVSLGVTNERHGSQHQWEHRKPSPSTSISISTIYLCTTTHLSRALKIEKVIRMLPCVMMNMHDFKLHYKWSIYIYTYIFPELELRSGIIGQSIQAPQSIGDLLFWITLPRSRESNGKTQSI